MGRLTRRLAIVLLLASLLLATGCWPPGNTGGQGEATETLAGGESGDELTVAIAGMVTPEEGLEYYQDLARYLGAEAGVEVHLFHKAEYAEVNAMLEQGKIDMAFVCSGPYVAGHDGFGLELLGAPVVNGAPVYYSYLIVPADSAITSLEGLRGKTFAFTDPQSNTGKTVPTYLLAKMGETPESYFGKSYFTYSHDNSIKAVASGEADGAMVDSLIYDYAARTDPTYTSKTKVILKSDPFGIPPVVVRPDMEPALKTKLRDALLDAHTTPEGQAILAKMGIEKFVEVDDSDYDSIRAMNEWVSKNQ